MKIRKATVEDAIPAAAIIFLAMEEILYQFMGKKDPALALSFLTDLMKKPGNQYSWQNCWLAELDGGIAGAVLVYDGKLLNTLRAPVGKLIHERFGLDFNPEDETAAGEWYIDSLAVNPEMQGRKIGSAILEFLIAEYVVKQKQTLGLLVEDNNTGAKKLYLKLGFKTVGEKLLEGKKMEHLQYQPT